MQLFRATTWLRLLRAQFTVRNDCSLDRKPCSDHHGVKSMSSSCMCCLSKCTGHCLCDELSQHFMLVVGTCGTLCIKMVTEYAVKPLSAISAAGAVLLAVACTLSTKPVVHF